MFVSIYNFFKSRIWLAHLLFIGTLGLFIALGSFIKLEEDISSMLPDSKGITTIRDVLSHTKTGEKLVFLASFRDSSYVNQDSLISATKLYYEGLTASCGKWIDTADLQAGSGMEESMSRIFAEHLPLFLTEKDYLALDSLTRPERIRQSVAANKKVLLSPASIVLKSMIAADPIGMSKTVWAKLALLQFDPDYELYDGYIFSKNGRRLTFFLKPKAQSSETGVNSRFFSALNAYQDSFEAAHPAVHITYFGAAAVAAGNASQMRTDTMVTLSVTIVLLMGLCLYYFRKKRTPLLLFLPVLYGACMGVAVMYLVQGSISVIALGAGAIVMGIAMDYSIHFLSHARESDDMESTIRELQRPLTVGSFTTIAAFLSLRFVHLPLLRDLGLFAAVSLIGAAFCTLIFLPHFPIGKRSTGAGKPTVFERLARIDLSKSRVLLWSIILLTPLMIWWSLRVQFDDDLMHLNYLSPRLKAAEEEVSAASAYALSSQFVISQGRTEEEALQKSEAIWPQLDSMQRHGMIRTSSVPAMLVPSRKQQQERIARWTSFWNEARRTSVIAAVREAARAESFSAAAFERFEKSLVEPPATLDSQSLVDLKSLFPGGFSRDEKGNYYVVAALKIPPNHRRQVMTALSTNSEATVTDRQQAAAQLVQLLNTDFQNIALYSSLIVFFALLIAYGRIELAVISFLPMAISWVWILGLMAMLGIKFNIVNIIISTLIFGLGDDYSIFTLDGLMERYKLKSDHTSSVRQAVYVSVATVLIGLGALLLARHPALRSIAALSVTGILCVLIISQTLQPALFSALIQRRADKGFHPFTAWSLLKSSFAMTWFVFCCVTVSVAGIFLILLWPFHRGSGKLLFHRLLRRGTWSVLYIMGNVRKRVINRRLADFSKPAVYIANHSSFLDILLTTSLNPRLVLLTNKWVYRSPVFGAVVRLAEYYPVADGAEESLEPLRDLTRRGYSIVVFPEGTRSKTDRVQRFHKGAFFISDRLGLDIVPLVIHGAHYTMQKGDWLLKDGTLSTHIYPRIAPQAPMAASTANDKNVAVSGSGEEALLPAYSIRAKEFNVWFRKELAAIKAIDETPAYFREQLIRSYTYKGPVLEWYCRVKTGLERNYETLHQLLPREGDIYDLGCGYGFATYLLHWSAPGRRITGVDYDKEKIATASALHLRDDFVRFDAADLREYPLSAAQAMIISDVLHYLLPAEQETLLLRCVAALKPGGMLIIRDGVTELSTRQKRTALTELFSTRILGFNQTTNELHFISQKWLEAFASTHRMSIEILDQTKFTSNLMFVLRKP